MKDRILNTEVKILNHTFSTKRILFHPLFSGSFFMVFGSNMANFIAYLYHLILGRIMGPSLYGDLVATISLIGFIMSMVSFFSIVIVKFISSANDKDVPGILNWFKEKTIVASLGVSILIWIASPFVGDYVHLSRNISILFAPILFFSIIAFVYKSFLMGVVKFKQAAIVTNVELLGRLLFGLVFVIVGMKVFGAILGMLIAAAGGFLLAGLFLKDVGFSKIKVNGFDWKKVFSYALPVFIVSISFTSLLTVDIVLVKHFFSSHDAGIYGSVSNLGKIIFYGTAPIGSVMFPLIAKKKSQKGKYMNIFLLSTLLVFGMGIGILLVYYLFPSIAIKVLYGDKFLEGTKYLILMGTYYILYSVANLFSSFFMSIDRTKPLLVLPFFSLIQIIGIYLLHANFSLIIGASILSVSLLLIYLGIYFAYDSKKQKI